MVEVIGRYYAKGTIPRRFKRFKCHIDAVSLFQPAMSLWVQSQNTWLAVPSSWQGRPFVSMNVARASALG
jgi:hypothetical protein